MYLSNLKHTLQRNSVNKETANHEHGFCKNLYTSTCYVRPLLESAAQAWAPIQKGSIDRIESVQRYFIKVAQTG